MLGDDSQTVWKPNHLLAFLKRAYRIAYPAFHKVIVDTTLTGVGAVPALNGTVAVPAVFLPGVSAAEVDQPGEITGLRVRLTGTATITEPMPVSWFWMSRAYIDPLTLAAPKINFLQQYNDIFELQVVGVKSLAIPTVLDATALDGSNNAGFMEWLSCQMMVFCMQARETAQGEDKRGYGRRRLLDQADADRMRNRYRMPKPHYTLFSDIER